MTATNPIDDAIGQAIPTARRLRDTIADKLAMLPAVDHNGYPAPLAEGGRPAVEEEASTSLDAPPARPPLAAPQGPLDPAASPFTDHDLTPRQKFRAYEYMHSMRVDYRQAVEALFDPAYDRALRSSLS